MFDVTAKAPYLPGPDVIAGRDPSEADVWARNPEQPGPDVVAYRAGYIYVVIADAGPPPDTSPISATLDGLGTIASASLLGTGATTATLAGVGTVAAASLLGTGAISSTLDGIGTIAAASLLGASSLTSTLDGVGAMTAAVLGAGAISSTLDGVGDLSGSLLGDGALSSTLDGLGLLSGAIGGTGDITATLDGGATMTGALDGTGNLTAALDGVGTLAGGILGAGTMLATMTGAGTVSALLVGAAALAATVNGLGGVPRAILTDAFLPRPALWRPIMNYAITFSSHFAGLVDEVIAGDVLCRSSLGVYRLADAAAIAAGGVPLGVAVTAGGPSEPVLIQHTGEIDSTVADLPPGAETLALVSATGRIMRIIAPTPTDAVIGRVDVNGNVALNFATPRLTRYGSAAPASGTWALGDLVYNSLPIAGGYVGWVCVAAGTPGTWNTFGPISP